MRIVWQNVLKLLKELAAELGRCTFGWLKRKLERLFSKNESKPPT